MSQSIPLSASTPIVSLDDAPLQWLEEGGLLSAGGFRASGVHCGVKAAKLDLMVLDAGRPVPAAGVFTSNRVCAAPVHQGRAVLQRGGLVRAVVVNSGNANAVTGDQGMANALEMAELAGQALDADPEKILVGSTGVIGQQLPMAALRSGIPAAVEALGTRDEHADAAARAILTTDTVPKACACTVELSGGSVTIGGIAKGSGMIAPDLVLAPHATTLAYLTTDAVLDPVEVSRVLDHAMLQSFNAITVDSDTSTNDTVLLLASGASTVAPVSRADRVALQNAVDAVAQKLALMVVRDGEGANRLLEFHVSGAATFEQARRIARTVADSPLVKTAFHEGEPNWGRLLMAVGKSDREVVEQRIAIAVGGLEIVTGGLRVEHDPAELSRRMTTDDVLVEIDLGLGDAAASVWGCDLSAEYVRINASYMS